MQFHHKYLPLYAALGLAPLTSMAQSLISNPLKSLSVSEDSPWDVTGSASLGLIQGNADSLNYALQLLGNYEQGDTSAIIGADLFYSENNNVATTNSFRLHGQYNRAISDRLYYGLNGSYLTNNVADIDYRIDLGLGLGYYFIKNDRTTLSMEAGPGVAWESQGGLSRNFATISFRERFEHQLSRRSKIWQSATFTPEINDFNDSFLTAEVGIDTLISEHWSLRSSVRYQYDSTPAAGRQSDDTSILMGLAYSAAGFEEPTIGSTSPTSNAPEAIQQGWTSSAALGLSLAKGNSDSLSVNLAFDSAYREASKEMFYSADYTYAEDDGEQSADALRATAQYNHLLNDYTFLGAGIGFLRDDIADVAYRFTPAFTLGHYFVKNDSMTLSVEAGPGYTFEEVGGIEDDYFAIVAGEKFAWEVNERVTFKQSLVATLDPQDGDNYLLVADAALEVDLTKKIAWRIAASWAYDNDPAAGRDKEDISLTTGISIKF